MKKYLVSLVGLALFSIVMVGCGSKSDAFLEEGSVWTHKITPTSTAKITIVDETTWQYEDAHTKEPVTIVLKKKNEYHGYPAYDVIESGGQSPFMTAKREEGIIIVPIDKNGLKQMDIQFPKNKKWSDEKIKKEIQSVAKNPDYTKQANND